MYLELSLTDYLNVLAEHGIDLDVDALTRHRVRVQYHGDASLHDKWHVYDCIVWETILGNGRFVLIDGRWFEIAPQYAAAVSNFVTSITNNDFQFPDSAAGQDEDEYNAGS